MMCSGAAPRERTTSFSADATAVVCGSIPPTAAADAAEPSGEATEPASAGRTGSAPARLCSASSKIVRTSLLSTASLRSTSDVGKRVAGNSDASATPKSWNTHRGIAAAAGRSAPEQQRRVMGKIHVHGQARYRAATVEKRSRDKIDGTNIHDRSTRRWKTASSSSPSA